jgi:RNA polymerase sigma-70 factor (ECF subfamily)
VRTTTQEALWVLRAQSGDRDALELLLGSIQPPLHRYVRGLVGAFHADDVLQDTLILIARKLAWLHRAELFRAWAFRIASRLAFKHLKKERRRPEDAVDDSELRQFPAAEIPPDDRLKDLLTTDVISPASRAVLMLHFAEQLPMEEVAAILEIPIGTAKSRLAYGLATIRKHLH